MKTNQKVKLTKKERTLLREVDAELGKKATCLLSSAKRGLSEEGYQLIKDILIEMMRSLPADNELTAPMPLNDRLDWTARMIDLMYQLDNVVFLEHGCTTAHNLAEIGGISGVSAEAIRQTEMKAVKKVHKNNTKEELADFKKAITQWAEVRHEESLDFLENGSPVITGKDRKLIDAAHTRITQRSA